MGEATLMGRMMEDFPLSLTTVIERAERHGATNVHASVLAENRPMLELLHKIAPGAHEELERGVVDLVFALQTSA